MSARKSLAPTDAQATDVKCVLKCDNASDQVTAYTEATSLLFDPNRVLLRRVFFMDHDKTRYMSVGFHPAKNYQPLFEIGSPKQNPILLTDHHVQILAEHLTAQFDALWRDDFYNVRDGEFTMPSSTPYKTAILTVGEKKNRKSVFLKLQELRYLTYIFPIVQNQLTKHREAMADVMNYVLSTINSTAYVAPSPTAYRNILYYQLFEEIKTLLKYLVSCS